MIRRAEKKDIDRLEELLRQVLELHAEIRPDIFLSGTTKYTAKELEEILADEEKPIFVATDEKDCVIGYAFCVLKRQRIVVLVIFCGVRIRHQYRSSAYCGYLG